jgi:hypothetical protein
MPGLCPGHPRLDSAAEDRGRHIPREDALGTFGRPRWKRQSFLCFKEWKMKLSFSPASPFARKVRIAAIELGLIDKIEFVPATVVPGQPNEEYSKINPLKKLPALILDNGEVIVDSFVISEYLDDLAGGGKLIPSSGAAKWKVKSAASPRSSP